MSVSEVLGTARTVRVPAGEIAFRERGSGVPMVFVHGAAVNGDLWRRVAPAFSDAFRCIVLDMPLGGHAIPLDGARDLSLYGCAEILGDVLDALDLRDVVLVANDTGGAVSQALIGTRGERVGRLVLTSCDAFEHYPPKAIGWLKLAVRSRAALWLVAQAMRSRALQRTPLAYGWASHRRIEPPIMRSFLRGLLSSAGVRRDFARLLRLARARDMVRASEGVVAFDRPALVVWAAHEKFFPVPSGRRVAELLPQGRFELVEGSRTFIPEDQPERLVALMRDFLG